VVVSSSVNRVALLVPVLLAAAIGWIGFRDGDPLLIVLALGLLVDDPLVRHSESAGNTLALRGRIDQLQPMPAQPPYLASASTDPGTASATTPIPGMSPQVLAQLRAGNKIGAIKRYREEYGSGLKEAKDAVDEFARQLALPR
jgi:hypothetical protein